MWLREGRGSDAGEVGGGDEDLFVHQSSNEVFCLLARVV